MIQRGDKSPPSINSTRESSGIQKMIIPLAGMAKTPYIALADDDADDQEMLARRFLERYPDTVFKFFRDGQEIIHFLEACPTSALPHLIVLDYKMPMLNGVDVLKVLSRDSRYDAIHKIVWSTSGNHQYIDECMQNGAEKYLTKPNDISELDEIITQLSAVFQSAIVSTPT
jgi:CheY-like chemotaxis protein